MSDDSLLPRGRRRRSGCGLPGCLAVLMSLAILVGGGWFLMDRGLAALQDTLAPPPDYDGPGSGKVLVEVRRGQTGADIGKSLKEKDVVKSVDAFIDAFNDNPESSGIQVGFYQLKQKMKASTAVQMLVDQDNLIENAVTIPEGLRADDIVAILAKETKFPRSAFEQVLSRPAQLGLPAYAHGNPEGYLFPATYAFAPNAKPADMLRDMVDRWKQAADDTKLVENARRLGYTPHELMTVASLVEAEAPPTYMTKVARVIYNRLEDTSVTGGKLQLDATVNYALGRSGVIGVSVAETQNTDSPYNTYLHPGLPPGPIESPGQAAIEAATHPADGPWFFYVTVNLRTGETKFAATAAGHAKNVAEYREYCRTQSNRC